MEIFSGLRLPLKSEGTATTAIPSTAGCMLGHTLAPPQDVGYAQGVWLDTAKDTAGKCFRPKAEKVRLGMAGTEG